MGDSVVKKVAVVFKALQHLKQVRVSAGLASCMEVVCQAGAEGRMRMMVGWLVLLPIYLSSSRILPPLSASVGQTDGESAPTCTVVLL